MSILDNLRVRKVRNRTMVSVAALALVATGAIGHSVLSFSSPASAAAVVTSDLQTQAMPGFSRIVDRVKPAVVSVKVELVNAAAGTDDLSGPSQDLPPQMREFLRRFGEENGMVPRHKDARQAMALGSGFFISADGYVVTNNHVVEHAKTVSVTTDDGKVLSAEVIGTDPKTDLALLKVKEKGDYPFVSLAKEAPKVGDWVVAIGNPFGLGGTVTAGIVSANGRDIGAGPYDSFLQIDAPINKGNSGGPTFDMKGEVVGVNTAIFSPSGGSVGLAFAIPASTVDTVVASLEHGGVVSRGYLGVRIQTVDKAIADGIGLESASGAIVDEVEPATPAAGAGLKSGDVITRLNGKTIKDAADLTRQVGALKPGDKAELSIFRDGGTTTTNLTLGALKNEKVAAANVGTSDEGAPVLGVQLVPADQVPGAGDRGLVVVGIDPDGLAASNGLSEGDVILEVSGKAVKSPADVRAGLTTAKHDGKKAVLLKVKTADGSRFLAFAFPKA